jgi:hypothetical protein
MLKRKTVRQKCLVDARIYLDGELAIDCSIDDLTPEGARLIAEKPIPRFKRKVLIFIPSIGAVWAAHIRWRRGQSLGVEFIVGEADLIGTEKAPDPKLFALRMQCAQVSKTVKRMTVRMGKTPHGAGPANEALMLAGASSSKV